MMSTTRGSGGGRRLLVLSVLGVTCALACAPRKPEAGPRSDAHPLSTPDPPPVPSPAPPLAPVGGASVTQGKQVFAERCASCHGVDARGRSAPADLPRRPTDLTTPGYLCRSTSGRPIAVPTDADVESALERGTHRDAAFVKGLDATRRRSLTLHLKSLSREFAGDPQPLSWVEPETRDTPESRARGRAAYFAIGCWRCHGPTGAGDGEALASIRWNDAPIRTPIPALWARDASLCGSDPERVYRTISLGLRGSSDLMPAYQGMLELFGRPAEGTPEMWTHSLEGRADADLESVRAFYRQQPDPTALRAMKPSERRQRAGALLWDLVHWVRSLQAAG